MRKKCTALFLAAVMLLSMVPVSGAANATSFEVALSGNTTGSMKPGGTTILTATVTPKPNGSALSAERLRYAWSSSTEKVAEA